jgi:hypothetical protein
MEIRAIGTPEEIEELIEELRFAPWRLAGNGKEHPSHEDDGRVRACFKTEPKPVVELEPDENGNYII